MSTCRAWHAAHNELTTEAAECMCIFCFFLWGGCLFYFWFFFFWFWIVFFLVLFFLRLVPPRGPLVQHTAGTEEQRMQSIYTVNPVS